MVLEASNFLNFVLLFIKDYGYTREYCTKEVIYLKEKQNIQNSVTKKRFLTSKNGNSLDILTIYSLNR